MTGKKKILIIDDELDLTMLMEHILLSTGLYEVVVANDGIEGCNKISDEKPDLIMLDYIMPRLKGDEVLKFIRMKSGLTEIPVIVMSGLTPTGFPEEGVVEPDFNNLPGDLLGESSSIAFPGELIKNFKVSAVLSKPFSKQKLIEMVERVLKVSN